MKSTHVKNISLRRNVLPVVFDMVQLDTGNVIAFHVRDVTLPVGTTAKAFFAKPSGKIVYKESGITVTGQQITVPVDNQATAETGAVNAQVTLYNGADTLSSFAFKINVFPSLKDMLTQTSENVIGAFDQAVADAVAEIGDSLDPTLTQANKAADAKATGDAINSALASAANVGNITTETVDGYLDGTGAVVPPENLYAPITTDYIEIATGVSITVSADYTRSASRLWLVYCLYDSRYTLVGNRVIAINNETGKAFAKEITVDNPDAKYIRISFRTNLDATGGNNPLIRWSMYISNILDYFRKVSNFMKSQGSRENDNTLFYSAFVPRKPRFCFSKGKMWTEHWNTAEAYTAAGKDPNCFIINGDIQCTSDGVFVMYHDVNIDDKTDGTGAVNDMTWTQLQNVNVNRGVWRNLSWQGKEDGTTAKIPLFTTYLDICRRYGKIAFVEIKGESGNASLSGFGSDKIDELVGIIKAKGMQNSIFFAVSTSIRNYLSEKYPWLMQTVLLDANFTESSVNTYVERQNMNISAYVSAISAYPEGANTVRASGKLMLGYTSRSQTDQDTINAVNLGCDVVSVNHPIPEELL